MKPQFPLIALLLASGCTVAPEKLDKLARFQAALAAAGAEPTTEATTPRKKADRRPKADDAAEAPSES